ncbi:hypothetical protein [Streptomyces bobili]|uniref:AraC family transcriptional regulator n=1 Tax=Streptomyces bobili TaxID=67280 RepID=A0ABZ1QZ40_9ACTN|nr:hypothetical protein [Streptomyces bobili]
MSELLTLAGLSVPMRALRMLAAEYGDLPAPAVGVSTIYPERLELSLHKGLGAFEVWRAALGIGPDEVEFGEQAGSIWTLQASALYAGAEVRLVAYGPSLDSVRAGTGDGGGDA